MNHGYPAQRLKHEWWKWTPNGSSSLLGVQEDLAVNDPLTDRSLPRLESVGHCNALMPMQATMMVQIRTCPTAKGIPKSTHTEINQLLLLSTQTGRGTPSWIKFGVPPRRRIGRLSGTSPLEFVPDSARPRRRIAITSSGSRISGTSPEKRVRSKRHRPVNKTSTGTWRPPARHRSCPFGKGA